MDSSIEEIAGRDANSLNAKKIGEELLDGFVVCLDVAIKTNGYRIEEMKDICE